MNKIIKKLIRLVSYLLVIVTILPVILYGVFQIPSVQDYIIGEVLFKISDVAGVDIKYSKAQVAGVRRIKFENLFIGDVFNDTLIYSTKTEAVLPILFDIILEQKKGKIVLRKLVLEEADLKIRVDSTGRANLSFIVDYVKANRDPLKEKKPVNIRSIEIIDSRFVLQNDKPGRKPQGIDFRNLEFEDFNVLTKNLNFFADTVRMDVKSMAFTDRSGFDVNSMDCDLEICKKHMFFDNAIIQTDGSNIEAPKIRFSFDDFKDFQPEKIFEHVEFDMEFAQSTLNTYDLGYYSGFFRDNDQQISLTGRLYGPISNFKGKELLLGWGNFSYLSGNFNMYGLPDVEETFLVFNLKELITNSRDLTSLTLPGNKKLLMPESFEKLQNFRYRGNFTGFFTDFVAHGTLNTNLGDIRTDLSIVPDSVDAVSFSGRINAEEFLIGEIFGSSGMLGDISIDAEINGIYTRDVPLKADIQGFISKMSVRDYPYQNISVNGNISNKTFNGVLDVDDPNLNLEFEGLLDMAAEPRRYVFQANVIKANLYALNISEADPNYHGSFLMKANLTGNSLDELNGELNLLNSLFLKPNKQIQVYDLNIFIQNNAEVNELILRSDILDATLSGKYKLSGLHNYLINYMSDFVPALIKKSTTTGEQAEYSHLDLDVEFKRTEPFFNFFYPEYFISPYSRLKATYLSDGDEFFKFDFFTPELKIKSNRWEGFVFNLQSEDTVIHSIIGSRIFNLNNRIDFENFTMESTTSDNGIDFTTRWLNWDSTLYKGTLLGNISISENETGLKRYRIELDSSSITISDSLWHLSKCMLAFDSAGFELENFQFKHDDQYILAGGKLTDTAGDSLIFYFQDFNLANLNFFTKKRDIEFGGNINGKGNMSGRKENPLFFSSLSIKDFMLNGETLGNCNLNSAWNNRKQSLSVDAMTMHDEDAIIKLTGDYFPNEMGKMDFRISLNKLKTSIFEPFLTGTFSDLQGDVSGDVQLTGIKGKPSLSGRLNFEENALTVNYLNTRYSFSSELEISNNSFIFNSIELFDREGNMGVLNGMIRTEYLKNIALNLSINTRDVLCLDTGPEDNDQFYGIAYATGLVRLRGEPKSLRFDIDAETGENTRFFIPLNRESEVSEFNFINFVRTDTSETMIEKPESVYKVDLSGIQMNFDLDVTPEAEVQIIFDPKMGDIIRANGIGEMKMSVNTRGTFNLIGEYAIEKGDYLFTLQDVINKRLRIQEGSILRWTGDPLNAQIDITAVYRTKASLSDLYGTTTGDSYQGRVTVDCRIYLTGNLISPTVKYDLYLPYAEEETRNRVNSRISTEEDVSKQFLSLLVLNRFIPDQFNQDGQDESSSSSMAGVNANASELLSNQLSNWLSQISNDFDIGVNYRPGTELTDREVEVALSTQLLNDRLSINGSVDMKTNAEAENTNKIVGDFDVDYKINKKGKVRVRAFNRSNDNLLTEYSPYTQGFGVFYMEEFNSFGSLMRRYWAKISGKKRREAKMNKSEAE